MKNSKDYLKCCTKSFVNFTVVVHYCVNYSYIWDRCRHWYRLASFPAICIAHERKLGRSWDWCEYCHHSVTSNVIPRLMSPAFITCSMKLEARESGNEVNICTTSWDQKFITIRVCNLEPWTLNFEPLIYPALFQGQYEKQVWGRGYNDGPYMTLASFPSSFLAFPTRCMTQVGE